MLFQPTVRHRDIAFVNVAKKCMKSGAVVEMDKVCDFMRDD